MFGPLGLRGITGEVKVMVEGLVPRLAAASQPMASQLLVLWLSVAVREEEFRTGE